MGKTFILLKKKNTAAVAIHMLSSVGRCLPDWGVPAGAVVFWRNEKMVSFTFRLVSLDSETYF